LTEPPRPEDRPLPADPIPPEPPAPSPPPRGLTTFSIEGRRAPGLFVVGWLATLIGGGLAALTIVGIQGVAGAILWVAGLGLLSLGLVLLGGAQAIERRAAGAAYPGPSPVLVLLAVVAISQLAGVVVGAPLSAVGGAIPRPVGDLLAGLLQAGVFIGVVRLMVVGAGAMAWADMGLRGGRAYVAQALLGGAVFAGPVILVTTVVALVAVQLFGVIPPSPLPPTGTAAGLVLHLLAGAVVAPVAEEVLFRGFALTAWQRSVGARQAILRSSIVFVLAHVLFVGGDTFGEAARLALVGGIARVPIAFVLGWLYVRTGSLWGPIGLHATFNAILIVLAEMGAAAV
jgi:membrane protease YdiL (CAAX protease family)